MGTIEATNQTKNAPNNLSADEITEYWTTEFLTKRYKITSMTLWRWINRQINPFPEPKIKGSGGQNRWPKEAVIQWENLQGST